MCLINLAKRFFFEQRQEAKVKERRGISRKSCILKLYFLTLWDCLKKPKMPNDIYKASCLLPYIAVTIYYENQAWTSSDDLKHIIWVSSSLQHCTQPVLWNESHSDSCIAITPGSDVGLTCQAEDTFETECSRLWVKPNFIRKIMWGEKKAGRFPFLFFFFFRLSIPTCYFSKEIKWKSWCIYFIR